MRRSRRPDVEHLEGKTLLSGTTPGLADSLTVTPTLATTGTRVVLTFTETNISHQEITVLHGPSNDGFSINQNGKTVWISHPGALPLYLGIETLKPGESITIKGVWDGRANRGDPNNSGEHGPQLIGTFTVTNQQGNSGVGATFRLLPNSKPTHVVPPKPPAH